MEGGEEGGGGGALRCAWDCGAMAVVGLPRTGRSFLQIAVQINSLAGARNSVSADSGSGSVAGTGSGAAAGVGSASGSSSSNRSALPSCPSSVLDVIVSEEVGGKLMIQYKPAEEQTWRVVPAQIISGQLLGVAGVEGRAPPASALHPYRTRIGVAMVAVAVGVVSLPLLCGLCCGLFFCITGYFSVPRLPPHDQQRRLMAAVPHARRDIKTMHAL